MTRTFKIISSHFVHFKTEEWFKWFHVRLVPVLASFSAVMLQNATSTINCTNYHVVWVAFSKQTRLHCTKVHKYCRGTMEECLFSLFAVWAGWTRLYLKWAWTDEMKSHMLCWATWKNLLASSQSQVGLQQWTAPCGCLCELVHWLEILTNTETGLKRKLAMDLFHVYQ